MNVRNLFAWCGSFSCLVWKVVDSEEVVFCAKMVKNVQENRRIGKTPRFHITACLLLCTMLTATYSTRRCLRRVPWHSIMVLRITWLRRHLFSLQGIQWMKNSARSHMCTSTRGEMSLRTPLRTDYLAVRDETSLESPDDYFDSGLVHAKG